MIRSCLECLKSLDGAHGARKYCSPECRYAHRDRAKMIPCTECGKLRHPNRDRAEIICRDCRHSYRRGCRCDECRALVAAAAREYRQKFREKNGRSLSHEYRQPGRKHKWRPSAALRESICERDGWICQLCGDPVDASLGARHRMGVTLDHIEPQSLALIPDHSPSNLRLAHRSCNARRGNRIPIGA